MSQTLDPLPLCAGDFSLNTDFGFATQTSTIPRPNQPSSVSFNDKSLAFVNPLGIKVGDEVELVAASGVIDLQTVDVVFIKEIASFIQNYVWNSDGDNLEKNKTTSNVVDAIREFIIKIAEINATPFSFTSMIVWRFKSQLLASCLSVGSTESYISTNVSNTPQLIHVINNSTQVLNYKPLVLMNRNGDQSLMIERNVNLSLWLEQKRKENNFQEGNIVEEKAAVSIILSTDFLQRFIQRSILYTPNPLAKILYDFRTLPLEVRNTATLNLIFEAYNKLLSPKNLANPSVSNYAAALLTFS